VKIFKSSKQLPALLAASVWLFSHSAFGAFLYEADYNSNTINKFTPGGSKSAFATGLNGPTGLAFDSNGNLFEGDWNGEAIYKFSPGGSKSTFVSSGLNNPNALAFDKSGNLF